MLSKFSVKKPYTVIVAIVLVVILGFVSYSKMTMDLLPSINMPYAVISTTYSGASPETVEKVVTATLEQSMASVDNVEEVSSVSSEGVSMVILKFHENADMDSAMIEMRENLDLVEPYFPEEVGSSVIMKINPDMMPVMVSSVGISGKSDGEAASYIEEKIVPELKSVEGVASVSASGLIENYIDLTISAEKVKDLNSRLQEFYTEQAEKEIRDSVLKEAKKQAEEAASQQKEQLLSMGYSEENAQAAAEEIQSAAMEEAEKQADSLVEEQMKSVEIPETEITKDMLIGILSGQNFSMPAGSVSSEDGSSWLVRVGDELETPEELGSLVIMSIPDFGDVIMEDVADIGLSDNTSSMYTQVNGEYAVMLSLQKQPDYSTADVTNAVLARMEELEKENEGLSFHALMNQGDYVNVMIQTVLSNLIMGAGLAVIILILFLRKIRPTLIVAASILLSVVTAFVLMFLFGISLNMISMSGLALGVGMLVDNSIVVMENICRMLSEGKSAKEAAVEGAREVGGAITASTLTTIVVFLPIIFTEGLTRQIFTDMALTITFSLLASLVVALTLVPSASSRMLAKNFRMRRTFIDKLADGYAKLLDRSLNHRWIAIGLSIVMLAGSVILALRSGTELFPSMDSGSVSVSVSMPDTYSWDETCSALDDLYTTLSGVTDVETVGIINNGSSTGGDMSLLSMGSGGTNIYLLLKEERTATVDEIASEIREKTKDLPYEVSVSSANMDMSMLSGGDVAIDVYGSDLDDLRRSAQMVADAIGETEGIAEVDNGLSETTGELRIEVDKTKAISKGLTVAQVYAAVAEELSGAPTSGEITSGSTEYTITVRDDRDLQITAENLENLEIENTSEEKVRLGDIASVVKTEGFSSISRQGQERYVSVSASVDAGYISGTVNEQVEEKLRQLELPEGCRYEISGESESMRSTFNDMALMLVLAIVFIYLVMVAQFQSFLSPFIIMFTIPLAFTGGFLGLAAAGMPISAVAILGFIILVGIVVNNGIVFVDYANQQMEAGYTKRQALLRAGRNRIRPILMTALTTIFALVAMAVDTSMGAELMQPMAVATMGGLVYSTLLTLFLIPAMYSLMKREKKPVIRDEVSEIEGKAETDL